jgi:hypothetical protein
MHLIVVRSFALPDQTPISGKAFALYQAKPLPDCLLCIISILGTSSIHTRHYIRFEHIRALPGFHIHVNLKIPALYCILSIIRLLWLSTTRIVILNLDEISDSHLTCRLFLFGPSLQQH